MEERILDSDIAIKMSGVKKKYRLGQIGGGTLQADIQSWWARIRGKEDPNTKIGEERVMGETFMALRGIDLTIKKGEAIGIIGGNGAGKSTLLKILSRVTAPTDGEIDINGRITSMLEVGTGFNGEMTGRENVYLNGAILGMTKAEIDAKMEQIIEFSEVRDFIDTPVKRYSSGMYVKLAFSVAAHLDSEIMIMDEVLAVGDVKFQQKCLKKMRAAAKEEGRTVLYVSHNMNTIRQLCDRCIVLEQGKVVFEGEVEKAIGVYLGKNSRVGYHIDLRNIERSSWFKPDRVKMEWFNLDTKSGLFEMDSKLKGTLVVSSKDCYSDVVLGVFLLNQGTAVTSMKSSPIIKLNKVDDNEIKFEIDLKRLAPATYTIKLLLSQVNEYGGISYFDVLNDVCSFEIVQKKGFMNNHKWSIVDNGYLTGSEIVLLN